MEAINLHPLCSAFPEMKKHEFSKLKASIKKHGQEVPIVVLDRQVLDGRHRMQACLELKIKPVTVTYKGDDPLGFVMLMNLERRHLSTSQRSMVAANIANVTKADAGRLSNDATANLQSHTRAEAAERLNVSERSVNTAKKIQAHAPANVVAAVSNGELSLNAAQRIVSHVDAKEGELLTVDEMKKAAAAATETRKHHINNARQHAEHLLKALNSAALVGGGIPDTFKLAQLIRDSARRLKDIAGEVCYE